MTCVEVAQDLQGLVGTDESQVDGEGRHSSCGREKFALRFFNRRVAHRHRTDPIDLGQAYPTDASYNLVPVPDQGKCKFVPVALNYVHGSQL